MHILGIDPGIVHTGVVSLRFDLVDKVLEVKHEAIAGFSIQRIKDWVEHDSEIFAEKYKPRSHFSTDPKMQKLEHELKQELPQTKLILNTGVTKVVRREVMELFHCWKFPTVTHHQDLRSAARIGLYGALKDDVLNMGVLFPYVNDYLNGVPWDVRT